MAIRLPIVTTCGFCEYLAGTRECGFVRRGPLVSSLVNRTEYETGALLIVPNRHLSTVLEPHYHMHVVPRYPGSDPTKIYSETNFEPISIGQQRDLAARIGRAVV